MRLDQATEIALGRDTAAADASLGEPVEVRGEGPPLELVVVGVVALPSIEDPYPLAEGAALTADALHALRLDEPGPGDAAFRKLLLRFSEGVGREEALAALGLPETETNDDDVGYPTPPPEIARLDEVRYFPALLAGLVALLLGVLAVGHALFVTVWRRGHDLAVLAALGLHASAASRLPWIGRRLRSPSWPSRSAVRWASSAAGSCGRASRGAWASPPTPPCPVCCWRRWHPWSPSCSSRSPSRPHVGPDVSRSPASSGPSDTPGRSGAQRRRSLGGVVTWAMRRCRRSVPDQHVTISRSSGCGP